MIFEENIQNLVFARNAHQFLSPQEGFFSIK